MMGLFAAVHESALGTSRTNANAVKCPQLLEADVRLKSANSRFDPKRS
jgi:hypothetical protein